jgi:uncharacterized protein YdcH (DUF465 family)
MDQYLSVKQFAEQAGVSTQRIYQLLTKSLQPFCKSKDGIKYISIEGLSVFNKGPLQEFAKDLPNDLQTIAKEIKESETSENELLKETIETLRQQLAVKDEQIAVKDEQLAAKDKQLEDLTATLRSSQEQQKALTDALTAAQALHAGTIQERLAVAQDQSEEVSAVEEKEEPEKRGFFGWLFGKKKDNQ